MSVTITFSLHCAECEAPLPEIENLVAIPMEGPLDDPKIHMHYLEDELELLRCPKCGADMPDVGDSYSCGADAVFWSTDYSIDPWPERKDRVTVELTNDLPSRFTTEQGVRYSVVRVNHYDLDRMGLPVSAPPFPIHSFGRYYVETDRGVALLECKPALNPDGTRELDRQEWYLVGLRIYPSGPKQKPTPTEWPASALGQNLHAYSLLHRLEVELRWFARQVMRSKYGENWWDEERFWREVASKDNIEEIRKSVEIAKDRMAEEQAQPYVKLAATDLFAYMDLRALRAIVEAFWEVFRDYVPRKGIFRGMLETLEIIRNAVAHNRPISREALSEVRKARKVVSRIVSESGIA